MQPNWAGYRPIESDDGLAARRFWSDDADDYLAEHGAFLGERLLRWCPEGLIEDEAHLLGDLTGLDVLEVGCGAAQASRWVADEGARVVGIDIAAGMLRHRDGALAVLADARVLPFADEAFDVAFTAFGAISFVPDPERIHREVARVLRPGGRWVFAVPHPILWCFPSDASSPAALVAGRPYFDRTPYVETDETGRPNYAEYQHTLGDHVRGIAGAGLQLVDLIEPEWDPRSNQSWEQWSQTRGEILPGTAIFVTCKP